MNIKSFLENLSDKITSKIYENNPGMDEIQKAKVKYGTDIFLYNFTKLPIVFVLAIILGIFPEFLIFSALFGILKTFSGGFHAKNYWSCLAVTIIFSIAISFLFINIADTPMVNIYSVMITSIITFLIILIFAPIETENKPLKDTKKRKKNKIVALVIFAIYTVIFTVITCLGINKTLSSLFLAVNLVEILSLTPLLFKVFRLKYLYGIERREA